LTDRTKQKRKLRWDGTPRTVPRHPYRDSAIVYAVLAGIVVGVTALTGGNMRTALIIAPLLFVVATGYSWWRWRQRERQEAENR
jgi:4-amino-4-deoxy-L-arabinose transferase-like glycosyltransferase